MKITRVMVQTGLSGTDLLYIETDLPQAAFPFESSGEKFKTEVANGHGIEYAKKHFSDYKIMVLDHSDESKEFGWKEL